MVTFQAYKDTDYRCCTVCDYKVVIETDKGTMITASVMDDSDLASFNINEAITKISDTSKKQDWFYPQELAVGIDDINNFINGGIEQGDTPLGAFKSVLSDIRESGCQCTNEVKELLNMIQL